MGFGERELDPRNLMLRYAIAILSAGVVVSLLLLFPPLTRAPFLLGVLAVLLITLYTGLGPGLVTSVLSALGILYFVMPPQRTIEISKQDTLLLVLFLLCEIIIATLTAQRDRQRRSAQQRAGQLRQMNAELEERVTERTAQLAAANVDLSREIAERTEIAEELQHAVQQAKDLIRYAPSAIYEVDFQGPRFTRVNDAMCAMSGYTREELLATNPFDLMDEESKTRLQARWKAVLAGERIDEAVEYRVLAKDGHALYITLRTRLLLRDGKPMGAFVIAHDITDRKRAEQTVQAAHARLREILESIQDGFFALDRDWRFTYINSRAAANVHLTRGDLIGQNMWERFPTLLGTPREAQYRRAMNERIPVHFEDEGLLSEAPYDIRVYPSADGISVYWLDITERRQNELKIQNLNLELERQKRELENTNKELESFSYSVSHDLRAPLGSIDNLTRMILKDYDPQLPPEATRLLVLVRENANQMSRLIEALLLLSRASRQALKRQTVSPRQVAEDVLNMLQPQLNGRQVEIVMGELPPCQADPVLLRQVYANLLSNAIKFTRNRPSAHIEMGSKTEQGETVYFVKDNGVGFDMEHADKLFGVFQRLHGEEEYAGTGIGLAIVQRIIRRHRGRVWAEGQVGQGASFYFTLASRER